MNLEKPDLSFILPGLLEVMTIRGGGREERILQIAKKLSEYYCISLIAPFFGKYYAQKKLDENLTLHNIYYPAVKEYPPQSQLAKTMAILGSIYYVFGTVLRIIQYRSIGIKAIVVSDVINGVLPSAIAALLGIKVIWYEGNLFPWLKRSERSTSVSHAILRGIYITLARLLYATARVVIVNDGMIRRAMAFYSITNKAIVAGPGVDTASFRPTERPSSKGKFCVGFIGRLSDEKGANQLLHICRYAEEELPEVEFVILGDGPYRKDLQKLSNIQHIGSVKHSRLSEMLSKVEVVITFQTTFGLGEVEALSCAKPIIGSGIGEMPELISRRSIGILCNNSTLSYIESISRLMQSRRLLLKLSQNARQTAVGDYDWSIIANKWKNVIVNACKETSNGNRGRIDTKQSSSLN